MHFEKYYYPALKFIKSTIYPLKLQQITLTGLDASFIKSIYDEMAQNDYCVILDEIISLTDKGKQYLIDNNPNPDNKLLHIRVLEYLNANEVYGKKLEFVSNLLHELANYEERYELVLVIRQLKKDDYIDYDGNENVLCGKNAGRHTPVYHTGIKACITNKGKEYLNPKTPVAPQTIHNTTHNINHSPGAIVGDNNQSSIIADTITTKPTTINVNDKKSNTVKKVLIGITILVIGTILALIVKSYLHLK